MSEERLVDLEVRISHLDDLVQNLNQTIYEQELRISKLEHINRKLADRVKELGDLAFSEKIIDEKPPHY